MEMDNTDLLPAKLAAAWNLTEGENGIRPFFICAYFTKIREFIPSEIKDKELFCCSWPEAFPVRRTGLSYPDRKTLP